MKWDKEYFDQIKKNLKARGWTIAMVAAANGKSASWIGEVLRGGYPFYKGYVLPVYFRQWLELNQLLPEQAEHTKSEGK